MNKYKITKAFLLCTPLAFILFQGCSQNKQPENDPKQGSHQSDTGVKSATADTEPPPPPLPRPNIEEMKPEQWLDYLSTEDPTHTHHLNKTAEWKNDAMNLLREKAMDESSESVLELGKQFEEIIQQKDRPSLIRDFALQHLMSLSEDTKDPSEIHTLSLRNMAKALEEKEETLAGTALLGYSRLHQKDQLPEQDQKLAIQALKSILLSNEGGDASRISALQVGHTFLGDQLKEPAWKIAQSSAPENVRTQAIMALGNFGDTNIQNWLASLQNSTDNQYLKAAAEHALKRSLNH